MASRIGRFVLRVSGDTSDLASELRDSAKDVDRYVQTWTNAAKLIQAAIGVVAIREITSGFAGFFTDTSRRINDLLDFSEITRTAVKDLQAIELAASRIGIEQSSVEDLIKDINERISEAVTLDSGAGKDVLEVLGLDPKELLDKSTIDRFRELGAAIGNVGDEATQLLLVRELSGSADQALRLLRNIQQIDDAASFIDDFNIGFDVSGIDAFRAAQREIADITAVIGALRDQIVISAAPAVKEFLQLFKSDTVRKFIESTFAGLKNLDEFFVRLAGRSNEFDAFITSLSTDFFGFLEEVGDFGVRQVDRIFDQFNARISGLGKSLNDAFNPVAIGSRLGQQYGRFLRDVDQTLLERFIRFERFGPSTFGRGFPRLDPTLDPEFANLTGFETIGKLVREFFTVPTEGELQRIAQAVTEELSNSANAVELVTQNADSSFSKLRTLLKGVQSDFEGIFDVELSKSVTQQFEKGITDPITKSLRDFAKRARESLKTPLDDLFAEQRQIELSLTAGLITDSERDLLSERVRKNYEAALEAVTQIRSPFARRLQVGTQEEFTARFDTSSQIRQELIRDKVQREQTRAIEASKKSTDELRRALIDAALEIKDLRRDDRFRRGLDQQNVAQTCPAITINQVNLI